MNLAERQHHHWARAGKVFGALEEAGSRRYRGHHSDESLSLLGGILPGGGKRLHVTVVAGESVDP